MATCPSCGKELPGEFPFCPFCTAPLSEQPSAGVQEERKVVSVLFCDLVGFTAASDTADPEDVRARIRPYHQCLREVIERHGGTVEKFVGDAVMAVFGAPLAHEDDAERAVRAGLRILDAIEELNAEVASLSLQVRVGINTGEAVVALGARPKEGEGIVTGDVVNTASRLQGAAPVNAVAVSEQTYRATERVFDYEPLGRVTVKGKPEPLPLYRPLAARARFGSEVTRTHATPLVGRELEKPLLIGTFERAAQQQSCQLVTLVGEPGVGKSRLCMELFQHVEERPGLVGWRQGRCLPYGEGIAFWALGEIVKAECGILESDSPDDVQAKLGSGVSETEQDRPWLLARLGPLVGLPGEPAAQEESFIAWRRFVEQLASDGPAVLVFEDLHWADPALLAFLEHVADWAEGVPLLILCTARPELYEQHAGWAGGLRNATTINLAPLSNQETAQLVSALLERAVLPAETQQALLERAGGNPLYAEEFVRLLTDRGGLEGEAEAEMPESVQALIAARLDTLSPDRKGLLQDASVIGKVFWTGALAAMGDRDQVEVEQALHELARKELVRPSRSSSMEGEAEYGFWHVLVRDVCYSQIPRAGRAERHQRAAAWIEQKTGERAEDLADVLAHHYLTALELSQAAGLGNQEELQSSAIRYLALAGERAMALDLERAEQSLARAVALAPHGHPERAFLLERWGNAASQQGRYRESKRGLEEAVTLYREEGNAIAAGRVLTALSQVLRRLGEPDAEALSEALTLLEAESPGPELVDAYAALAGQHFVASAYRETITVAERTFELANQLGLTPPVNALGYHAGARTALGERQGLNEMKQALASAIDQGKSRDAGVLYNNLALAIWQYDGPQAGLATSREGIEFAKRRGHATTGLTAQALTLLAESGQGEEALRDAEPLLARLASGPHVPALIEARSVQLRMLTLRSDSQPTCEDADRLANLVRGSPPEDLILGFFPAAQVLLARGQRQRAHQLLTELAELSTARSDVYYVSRLPDFIRTALVLADADLAQRFLEGVEPRAPLHAHALTASRAQLAEAGGNHSEAASLYADAARRWQQFGNVPEHAYALLGQGRCLRALGDPAAEAPLAEARDLFSRLGYKPALAETENLLGSTELTAS